MPKAAAPEPKKEKGKVKQQVSAQIKPAKQTKKDLGKNPASPDSGSAKYVIAIIIIFIIIAAAIVTNLLLNQKSQPSTSFDIFKKNYDAAPTVNIFVGDYNTSAFSITIGCATSLIEQIVASQSYHRNASTIDLNIVNQTSCIRTNGLGVTGGNYINTTLQNCLNTSSTEPSIYINYSSVNTTIIRPEYLYFAGNLLFLRECGVAPEMGG